MDSSTVLEEPGAKPHVKRQISWMTSHDSPALRWPENTQHFECTYGAWETEVPVKKRQYMYPYSTPKTGLAGKPSISLESPLSPTPHLTLQHPYPYPGHVLGSFKTQQHPPPWSFPGYPYCLSCGSSPLILHTAGALSLFLEIRSFSRLPLLTQLYIICRLPACLGPRACSTNNLTIG